jgi:hypothetical protein
MTDRAVEIVHRTGRHRDNQASSGTEKVARHAESVFRSINMLEDFAADHGVRAPTKRRCGDEVIEIAQHKLRRR